VAQIKAPDYDLGRLLWLVVACLSASLFAVLLQLLIIIMLPIKP
jgi:type IV secretory pathway component VirB8